MANIVCKGSLNFFSFFGFHLKFCETSLAYWTAFALQVRFSHTQSPTVRLRNCWWMNSELAAQVLKIRYRRYHGRGTKGCNCIFKGGTIGVLLYPIYVLCLLDKQDRSQMFDSWIKVITAAASAPSMRTLFLASSFLQPLNPEKYCWERREIQFVWFDGYHTKNIEKGKIVPISIKIVA